ncbi:hypothetical protein [Streptomyces sp. NPDC088246]|uniref:hypothetical protein n=1 Tax=Streptomyces sp. NPDC088246 TaxID=3365842 RepID=UPI00382D510C
MDFAQDERLPRAPVWTACPRGDGGPPTPVRTASPGLSLAWKLLWLAEDQEAEGRPAAKNLYDAVLLAEHPSTRLSPRLLRTVLGPHAEGFTPERCWTGWWTGPRSTPSIRGWTAIRAGCGSGWRVRFHNCWSGAPGSAEGRAAHQGRWPVRWLPSVARPAPLRRTLKRIGSHT